jgi:hypothetical protein
MLKNSEKMLASLEMMMKYQRMTLKSQVSQTDVLKNLCDSMK